MGDKNRKSQVDENAIANLKLELYEAIETKMNASLERDRQFIQSTIGAASKIGGYVISVVALAITLFGIKTCSDVKSTVETTTKSEVDDLIKTANPVAAYAKDTRRYLEGAMVNYYRIQLAAPKREFASNAPLPSDVSRMREILHDPETDDNLFSQVIDILISIAGRDDHSLLGADLTEMFVAKLPSLSWVQNSVAKRAEIVDALGRLAYADARAAILPTIDSENAETRLRIAAIKYAVRVSALNAIARVARIADDSDPAIKNAALQGIIALNPSSDKIKEYFLNIASDNAVSAQGLSNAFNMFSLLDERPLNTFFPSEEDKARVEQTTALIAQVLAICADRGVTVWFYLDRFSQKPNLSLANPNERGVSYGANPIAVQWSDASGVNKYLKSAMSEAHTSVIAKKFSVLTNAQSIARFSEAPYQLVANLGQDAAVELEGGNALTRDDAPYGIVFTSTEAQPSQNLSAAWNDGSGIKRTARVSKFRRPEDVTFRWKRATDSSP